MAPKRIRPGATGGGCGASCGDVGQAEALAFASALHSLPLHSALALASNFRLRIALSASAHFWRLPPESTYWPSQKIAPLGSLHCTSQPPLRSASHFTLSNFAWQSTWQDAVA